MNDGKHPAVVGIAKQGPQYLAAVERWCEGSVQLFWVTMFTERRAWRVWAIGAYCVFVFWLLLYLGSHPPNIICNDRRAGFKWSAGICTAVVTKYVNHHAAEWDQGAYGYLEVHPMT